VVSVGIDVGGVGRNIGEVGWVKVQVWIQLVFRGVVQMVVGMVRWVVRMEMIVLVILVVHGG